jgi:2-keto-4-pentenoate hydratase/2-oxohepta-3-ene-1,7-dioic acid hydratase in catechol pathway
MTWSLATYTARDGTGLGALREDGTLVTPAGLERWATAMELLADWPAAEPVLRDMDIGGAPAAGYDALLAPLRWPRKVICAGVNYRRHMREMGGEVPAARPHRHQGPGPRPVRLGGRTGRHHRYRR